MSLATRVETTLITALWPVERQAALIRGFALAILGTALLTVSAKIQVPFYPVPMTMQTYVVMVIAMAYGWRLGAATVALYLVQGAAAGSFVNQGTFRKSSGTGTVAIGVSVAAARRPPPSDPSPVSSLPRTPDERAR